MKKAIAILLLVLSGSAFALSDGDVYDLQRQVKFLQMNQAANDRYIQTLENRIAALEDRSSKPKMSKAEFDAEAERVMKKVQAAERKTK